MKIIVLQGSPNVQGSTALLAEAFKKGAEEAGHEVSIVHAAQADIETCTGCAACGYEGPCILSDGMDDLREEILSSDMLVFASPLYYFGMSAQLKTLIDRFCAFNSSLTNKHLKAALLTVGWEEDPEEFGVMRAYYEALVRYLQMEDCGQVCGLGCGTPEITRASVYPKEAYELGKSLA